MVSFLGQPAYTGTGKAELLSLKAFRLESEEIWILMKQEMMAWQWRQLDHMQIIGTLLQTDNHTVTPSLNLFTGRMLFLLPSQQCQSTEGDIL